MSPLKIKHLSLSVFFFALLLLGLNVYRDYGISWDEPQQRLIGAVSAKHIVEKIAPNWLPEKVKDLPELGAFVDRDYGVVFEVPAVILEKVLKLDDSRDVYFFRHIMTFFVFLAGVMATYSLSARRFNDWRVGLLTAIFLVLSPRFFAEAFYNSKDIVFMAFFAIAMNTMVKFLILPTSRSAFIHAFATALATDVRIMGIVVLAGTIGVLLLKSIKGELTFFQFSRLVLIYLFATCLFVIAMFPFLWDNPLGHFAEVFHNMSKFRRGGEELYMGRFIWATELPWHYSLIWITITTPPLYLFLFVSGGFATFKLLIKNKLMLWANNEEMQDIIFFGFFSVPILSVIVLDSVLYNGWRQLYFIYPAFLLVASNGWFALWKASWSFLKAKVILLSLTIGSLLFSTYWMWSEHPMQNVYFNILAAGDGLRNKFEMDYWGLGNRQALEYILAHDESQRISVLVDSRTPLEISLMMLKPEDRGRLSLIQDKSSPLYALTNYCKVKEISDVKYSKEYDLHYQIKIDNEAILSVYKFKVDPAVKTIMHRVNEGTIHSQLNSATPFSVSSCPVSFSFSRYLSTILASRIKCF